MVRRRDVHDPERTMQWQDVGRPLDRAQEKPFVITV
jgi:hypothetical protein